MCQRATEDSKISSKLINSNSKRENENDRADVLEKWLVEPQHFMIAWFMQMTNLYSEKYDSYEMAEEIFKRTDKQADCKNTKEFLECKLASHEFKLLAKAYHKWFDQSNDQVTDIEEVMKYYKDEMINFGRLLSQKLQEKRIKNITKKIVAMEESSKTLPDKKNISKNSTIE